MIVPTKLYCHGCGKDFIAKMDMELNGNHEIICPNCGHVHYRVVENGEVTGERYRSSMQTYSCSTVYVTITNTSSTSGSIYLSDSWLTFASAC